MAASKEQQDTYDALNRARTETARAPTTGTAAGAAGADGGTYMLFKSADAGPDRIGGAEYVYTEANTSAAGGMGEDARYESFSDPAPAAGAGPGQPRGMAVARVSGAEYVYSA